MMVSLKKTAVALLAFALIGTNTAFANGANPSPGGEKVPIEQLQPAAKIPTESVVLTPVGGELIFSDSPETFSGSGAFYRDWADGEFRVFWHHQNVSNQTMTVAVAFTNESDERVMLYSKGGGVGTSIYPDIAGLWGMNDFLRTRGTTKMLKILEPGEHYWIETPTAAGLTTSGIAQFNAVTQHGHQPAAVTVTVLGYEEGQKPANPLDVEILPLGEHTVRGKWEHFDRLGTIHYDPAMGRVFKPIDSAASGPWMDAMPGEYEWGYSAVDDRYFLNNGNYGVLYRWDIRMTNSLHKPTKIKVYMTPSGGFGQYSLQWNQQIYNSGFIMYTHAWNFTSFMLGANGGHYQMLTSLVGGSYGPQTFYFTAE